MEHTEMMIALYGLLKSLAAVGIGAAAIACVVAVGRIIAVERAFRRQNPPINTTIDNSTQDLAAAYLRSIQQ